MTTLTKMPLQIAICGLVAAELCLTKITNESFSKLEAYASSLLNKYEKPKTTISEIVKHITEKYLHSADTKVTEKLDMPSEVAVDVLFILKYGQYSDPLEQIELLLVAQTVQNKYNPSTLTPDMMVEYIISQV